MDEDIPRGIKVGLFLLDLDSDVNYCLGEENNRHVLYKLNITSARW